MPPPLACCAVKARAPRKAAAAVASGISTPTGVLSAPGSALLVVLMKSLAFPATNGVRVGNGVAAGASVGDGVAVEEERDERRDTKVKQGRERSDG